jgi:hypothetical protein
VHKTKQGFFVRDLGYERNSFFELTAVKTNHGKLATGRRLRQSSMVVGMACGGTSAPRTPPVATVSAGAPPPSVRLEREAPV